MKDELIKSALLGTDKYFPPVEQTQDPLLRKGLAITDKPEALLSSYFIFKTQSHAGQIVEKKTFTCQPYKESPLINYIPKPLEDLFNQAILEEDLEYLRYLTSICETKSLTLTHRLVPDFSKYISKINTSDHICGPFLNWLNYALGNTESEDNPQFDFSTASTTDRIEFIRTLRFEDTETARNLIVADFDKEKAETRELWIQALSINLGDNDCALLIKSLDDKSKKVRAIAIELLCKHWNNEVAQKLITYFQQLVAKEEKSGFLGIKKSIVLKVLNIPMPSEIKKDFGLQDLSSDKRIPDNIFIIGQILQKLSLRKLAEQYQISPQLMLESLFDLHPAMSEILESQFEEFNDDELLYHAFKEGMIANVQLLKYLSLDKAEIFFEKFIVADVNSLSNIINIIADQPYFELNRTISELLIKKIAELPYISGRIKSLGYYLPQECQRSIVRLLDNPTQPNTANLKHLQTALINKYNVENIHL